MHPKPELATRSVARRHFDSAASVLDRHRRHSSLGALADQFERHLPQRSMLWIDGIVRDALPHSGSMRNRAARYWIWIKAAPQTGMETESPLFMTAADPGHDPPSPIAAPFRTGLGSSQPWPERT